MSSQSALATLPPITLAAVTTAAAMYPVDVMRALKMASATGENRSTAQLFKAFIATHGLRGLFSQGVIPELARATWMRISKFFLFPIIHEAVFDKPPSKGNGATKALAGALATIPETLTISPMELAKIGLQLDSQNQHKNKSMSVVKALMAQRGWKGLFLGYFGLQYRQASWTAAYFGSLGTFTGYSTQLIAAAGGDPKSRVGKTMSEVSAGFFAGVLGSAFNTPGDVIRTNIQKQALQSAGAHEAFTPGYVAAGVRDFFVMGGHIARANGVAGLYKGFGFKALHLGGSGGLLATLVPFFKEALGVTRE